MTEPLRVLIVDDEAGIRDSLADLLELEGFRVNQAENGREAVERAQEEPYDFILMDIRMPEMDGVEALQRIKATDPETEVIMITAFTQDERVAEALQGGAMDVFFKPLDLDRLLGLLHPLPSPQEQTRV